MPSRGLRIVSDVGDFAARDQNGRTQTLAALTGSLGLILVVVHSADCWPYCKAQLVDLSRNRKTFESAGYRVAGLSYDSVAVLRDFASRHGIDVLLLADPESTLIERLGLLNTEPEPGHPQYRVAHPATLWIDARGRVLRADVEDRYSHRPLLAALRPDGEAAAVHGAASLGAGFSVQPLAVETTLSPGHVFPLELEISPRNCAYVYAADAAGRARVRELAVDDVQVGATDAAGEDAQSQISRSGDRIGDIGEV